MAADRTQLYEVASSLGYSQVDVDNAFADDLERKASEGDQEYRERQCVVTLLALISHDEDTTGWVRLVEHVLGLARGRGEDQPPLMTRPHDWPPDE